MSKPEFRKKLQPGILRTGTSNIVVPGSRQSFPPEFNDKSRLSYYSTLFNTVELNSTFKKIPMASTFQRWEDEVGENFQFTIKMWKEITHVKKLEIDFGNIDLFMKAANSMQHKTGCLLLQFPGSISVEHYQKVEDILEKIDDNDPGKKWRKAIEFRNESWYIRETRELLNYFDASLVLHDMHKGKNMNVHFEEKFFYYRFHGPTGNYRGEYSDEFLQEQATIIRKLLKQGKDVYVYFNNTMGEAFKNARALIQMNNE